MDATAPQLHALLTATPFAPFRLLLSRQLPCDVSSPADVLLTTSKLYVVIGRDADGIAVDVRQIPLAQITSVTT